MSVPAGRTRVSFASLHTIRERVKHFSERVKLHGRPRRRFLAEQRALLASRLLPLMIVLTSVTALAALSDLVRPPPFWSRAAAIAEMATALLFAVGAIAAHMLKRHLESLNAVAIAQGVFATLGFAFVARGSGAEASPYLLVGPVMTAAIVSLLPLPPRMAMVLAAFGYVGALIGMVDARLPAHLMAIALLAGGGWLSLKRHRRALESFLRVERLSARVARLRKMQEQLVVAEKLEAMRVLVGGMMHEVNNALAVSVASTEQATRALPADPDTATAALKRATGGLGRIRGTVDRLRRFAMAESGVLEPADVGAMLDFALEIASARGRGAIIIERSYEPDAGAVQVHVSALAEALFQVARNAVESMPGGGCIRASVRRVVDKVVLSVSDQGTGIPPEDLARVFDPYYSRGGGNKAGMGLSAVYGLVRSLGGTIEIHSDIGRGTEVAIVLPQKNAK